MERPTRNVVDFGKLVHWTFTKFYGHHNPRELEWLMIQNLYAEHPERFEYTAPHGDDNHISVRANIIALGTGKPFSLNFHINFIGQKVISVSRYCRVERTNVLVCAHVQRETEYSFADSYSERS
jgi:hypothetical protein